jgi:hypothetical protein
MLKSPSVPLRPVDVRPQIKLCSVLHAFQQQPTMLGYIPVPNSAPLQHVRVATANPALPPSNVNPRRAIHLHSFLSRTVDSVTHKRLVLNRKQRFEVASALTWAVLHPCDSTWLENEIHDHRVHMFLESAHSTISHPYLSYTFSTTATNSTMSKARSPSGPSSYTAAQFHNSQIRNMALFTLELRLIELGRNLPFDQVRREYHAAINSMSSPSQHPAVPHSQPQPQPATNQSSTIVEDFEVAEYQIRELYLDPGKTYADAADRCLRFLFPGPADMNTFDHASFRSTFFADVIAPIQATYELIPGSCASLIV